MATIATTSIADALAPPGSAPFARRYISAGTDYYYAAMRTASDTLAVYVSTNNGGSWAALTSFTHTGLQEWGSIVFESTFLHIAYRVGTGSADTIWYRRYNLNTGAWSAALQISATDDNAATIGSRWQGVDLVVYRHSDGAYAIVVAAAHSAPTPQYGAIAMGVSIDRTGKIYSNNGLITGNRYWMVAGTPSGRSGIACEAEHNGDGFTSGTPNMWITWGRNALYAVRLSWVNSSVGWQGPSNMVTVRSSLPTAQDYAAGRWDGTQWVMAVPSPDDTTIVRLYQRDKSNTVQTTYDSLTHPAGVVRYVAVSYDVTTKNPRVFAVGTSSNTIYYCDYNRGSNTWSAWSQLSASALAGSGTEWGVRRGGNGGSAKHDVVYSISGSPNTVTHAALATSSPPSVPVFDTSAQPYNPGGAANVNNALTLQWDFTDIDPGASQGTYAVSRQIGAGTVQWWSVAGAAWVSSETQNTSSTKALTLASGWGTDGGAAHQYKVRVWDNAGVPSSGYSQALLLYPSAPVNPTVSAPTNGATVAQDTVTVTWSVAEQTGIRAVVTQSGVTVYDSGALAGYSSTSYTVPYSLQNGLTYVVTLYTYNADGLISAGQARTINVAYVQPPAMTPALTPDTANGVMLVTATAPAPAGTQPAILSGDLYRRPAGTPVLNANPAFVGSTTGYAVGGGGSGALSYSTAQFISSPGAGRYVPSSGSTPTVESASVAIDATKQYLATAWIRPDTSGKPVTISINWYTAASAFISATTFTVAAPAAAAWQFLAVNGDPTVVSGAARASVAVGRTGTPTSSDAWYVDDVELEVYDAGAGTRVATGMAVGATYADWGVTSGIDYEYRFIAKGANGGVIAGPWTN